VAAELRTVAQLSRWPVPPPGGSCSPWGTGIELLQWALPLGRVVSPADALLDATGGVAAGPVVTHLRWASRPPSR
jgi:hypothetical protein